MNPIFAMGGYATYIWSAYGITLIILMINFIASLYEKNRTKEIVKTYLKQLNPDEC